MRKVFVCFMVVLLVGLLAVPAFAIGSSGTDEHRFNSILTFERIDFEGSSFGYTLPYPFNAGMLSGSGPDFSYGDLSSTSVMEFPELWGSQSTTYLTSTSAQLHGTMKGPMINSHSGVTFAGGMQVVDIDQLINGFYMTYPRADMRLGWCEVGIHCFDITGENFQGNYVTSTKWAYYGANFSGNGGTLNVGQWFDNFRQYAVDGKYLLISDIYVYLGYTPLSNSTLSIDIYSDGVTGHLSGADLFPNWVVGKELVSRAQVIEANNWYQWLLEAVTGFFDFEIIPGFSMSKIMVIVLTIGIMLWFITLLI